MRKYKNFAIFVLIGGISSTVNIVARIVFNHVVVYEIAIVLAFPVALSVAFSLNRALIFKSGHGDWRSEFFRFLIVNLVALVQVFVVSVVMARVVFPWIGMRFHPDVAAHALGLLSPICTSYWAHKHFTFRRAVSMPSPTGVVE